MLVDQLINRPVGLLALPLNRLQRKKPGIQALCPGIRGILEPTFRSKE